MPTGQLAFATQTCWESTLGPDGYAIIRPTNTSTPTTQWIAIAALPPTATVIGAYATYELAVNACQNNYNGLAT
jgi:hypothetical protein